MASHRISHSFRKKKPAPALAKQAQSALFSIASAHNGSNIRPLGAMLLAGCLSMPSPAQTSSPAPAAEPMLKPVIVRDTAEPSGKDSLRTRSTSIGKGQQELRDIPQSITVVTEKLIDDRNLDTLKDVLHNTAGITFLASEGGEEDIRLRGFSLAGTGDIFLDGMRDPAFYERDTFNNERIELLRCESSQQAAPCHERS
jgi:catecholate siderophore receptor